MTKEDLKFRFIIPLDEQEHGEPGYLYDRERLDAATKEKMESDKVSDNLTYEDYFLGEAATLDVSVNGEIESLYDYAMDGIDFPSTATDGEKVVAFNTIKFRRPNWTEAQVQQGILDYFSADRIENKEGLRKFFGYAY